MMEPNIGLQSYPKPNRSLLSLIKNFLVLSRWEYLPSAINEVGIPVLLALLVVPYSARFRWMTLIGLLVWWGGHFIGSHINCLTDYNVDQKYKTHLSKAVDEIGPRNIVRIIWVESILLTGLIVWMALRIKLPALILFWGGGLFLAFAYSCKPFFFKSRVLMNPLTLGFVLYVFPMFFVYLLIARSFSPFASIIIGLFALQMVPMFFMDEVSDYEEDKSCNISNPCVVYGRPKTVFLSVIIYFIATLSISLYVIFNYPLQTTSNWIFFIVSIAFFGYVLLDFITIYFLARKSAASKDSQFIMKIKKRIITPVWLMSSGVATIILLLITLVR